MLSGKLFSRWPISISISFRKVWCNKTLPPNIITYENCFRHNFFGALNVWLSPQTSKFFWASNWIKLAYHQNVGRSFITSQGWAGVFRKVWCIKPLPPKITTYENCTLPRPLAITIFKMLRSNFCAITRFETLRYVGYLIKSLMVADLIISYTDVLSYLE